MDAAELVSILIQGEGHSVEFKVQFPEQAHSIGKEMGALANSGGGILLVGVGDDGTPKGISNPEGAVERLAGIARTCSPSLDVLIGKFQLTKQIFIVYAKVKPARSLTLYQGKTFKRTGSTSHEATGDEVTSIVLGMQGGSSRSHSGIIQAVRSSKPASTRQTRRSSKKHEPMSAGANQQDEEPDINDIRRILTRIPMPNGQRDLFNALCDAGATGLTTSQLAKKMKREPQQVASILGALGNRINQTQGLQRKDGVFVVLDAKHVSGVWHFKMKPILRKALAAEGLI